MMGQSAKNVCFVRPPVFHSATWANVSYLVLMTFCAQCWWREGREVRCGEMGGYFSAGCKVLKSRRLKDAEGVEGQGRCSWSGGYKKTTISAENFTMVLSLLIASTINCYQGINNSKPLTSKLGISAAVRFL